LRATADQAVQQAGVQPLLDVDVGRNRSQHAFFGLPSPLQLWGSEQNGLLRLA
jgi:hypothetical protein